MRYVTPTFAEFPKLDFFLHRVMFYCLRICFFVRKSPFTLITSLRTVLEFPLLPILFSSSDVSLLFLIGPGIGEFSSAATSFEVGHIPYEEEDFLAAQSSVFL